MSSIKSLCRIGQMSMRNVRQMSAQKKMPTAAELDSKPLPEGLHPAFYKLKADQKLYQKADGIPIHFKRGTSDKILFYITVALTGVGMVGVLEFVYSLP